MRCLGVSSPARNCVKASSRPIGSHSTHLGWLKGLPWVGLWAPMAAALSGSDISDKDVALVRKHAAPFIVEAVEQDRSVYRLYHERLAEHLRGTVADEKIAQWRIAQVLRSRVPYSPNPGKDWTRAHPYVLSHLAAHALKAGTLGELVTDAVFLAAADPLRILQALSVSTDPQARRIYACYSLAFDRLRDQPTNVRLSYLEMTARQQADDEPAEIFGREGLRVAGACRGRASCRCQRIGRSWRLHQLTRSRWAR